MKYGNPKTYLDGICFDSRKEAKRYAELRLMERAGEISGLQIQVPFVLIPAQKDKSGKVVERAATYVADFVYNRAGQLVVEDAKGFRTDLYRLKRKLMLKIHGIRVVEV